VKDDAELARRRPEIEAVIAARIASGPTPVTRS
jgi:hypothetical protein